MPDPRALRIDIGPFHLDPTPGAGTWTARARDTPTRPGVPRAVLPGGAGATATRGGAAATPPSSAEVGENQDAGGPASAITAGWSDWVALAHRVLQADAMWRDTEARGDAWDEGFAAARDAAARNPYR